VIQQRIDSFLGSTLNDVTHAQLNLTHGHKIRTHNLTLRTDTLTHTHVLKH